MLRILFFPIKVLLGLAQLVALPLILAALAWLVLSPGWALLVCLGALAWLKWVGWAARASHGGVLRLIASQTAARSEARMVAGDRKVRARR